MQETWIGSGLGQEDPLEKEMASHSSILAWEIHGQRSLAGYSPWGHKRARRDVRTKQQKQLSPVTLATSLQDAIFPVAVVKTGFQGGYLTFAKS